MIGTFLQQSIIDEVAFSSFLIMMGLLGLILLCTNRFKAPRLLETTPTTTNELPSSASSRGGDALCTTLLAFKRRVSYP